MLVKLNDECYVEPTKVIGIQNNGNMGTASVELEGGSTLKPHITSPADYKNLVDTIMEAQARAASQGAGVRRSSRIT